MFAMSLVKPQLLQLPVSTGYGLGQAMMVVGLVLAPSGLVMTAMGAGFRPWFTDGRPQGHADIAVIGSASTLLQHRHAAPNRDERAPCRVGNRARLCACGGDYAARFGE
ncbi:hypothetical protein BKA25_002249 [Actinoalloteichus hymeniacidonis]|nr:hypothetical protein [Actinoalloteichus hymeniacidonis]